MIFIHIPKTGGTSIRDIVGGSGHKKVTDVDIEGKFSFAFVRNPYDRLVSIFFFGGGKKRRYENSTNGFNKSVYEFHKYVRNLGTKFEDGRLKGVGRSLQPQHHWLADAGGSVNLTFIGKFENIDKDWEHVARILKVKDTLGHLNKTDHKHYERYYTPEIKAIVRKLYGKDFKLFGYE